MTNLMKSKQPFLILRIILSVITVFFAIRVWLTLLNPTPNLNMAFMMFSLGLLFVIQGIEMYVMNKRKYFILTILTSLFVIGVGIFSYWVYLTIK
ncbi:hypothetical protein RJD24_08025 [Bacillaceae bacterium IKA-2]|nr:hypothetical protein RJD24_08025 [Bacillaceae bacterium IKA-2]